MNRQLHITIEEGDSALNVLEYLADLLQSEGQAREIDDMTEKGLEIQTLCSRLPDVIYWEDM